MVLAVENLNISCNEPSTSIAPIPPHRRSWSVDSRVKGFFAGSANIPMSHPYFAQCVIELTERPPHDIIVLYIGTATYDIQEYRDIQTSAFFSLGCTIKSLDVDNTFVPFADIEKAVAEAHIVLVSGGNTLYAIDRWRSLGLDVVLKDAAHRGTVMTGGSAGLICWFDGGHSDSMDPTSYREHMLCHSANTNHQQGPNKDWDYIRVEGLGIFPGLVCPHYDQIQSNGVARMADFDEMMTRHSYELGLGFDEFAALEINGQDFRVLTVPGKRRSGAEPLTPGVWIKYADESGVIETKLCPTSGKVRDLLQVLKDRAKHTRIDERMEVCRVQNPSVLNKAAT
eukprot:CCRYP_009498-RA/>CCRYP_009498-RA protein AED:0.03 eAED:0.03 QI:188/1/1/1/1/1/2/67/339